jgi:hypothetical protein
MMIPLDNGQVLFLKGRDEFDPVELIRVLEPLGFEPFITTRAELAEAEIRRILLERGISNIWQTVIFQEALLPRTPDVPALVAILREMLERLTPESEFVIVDRYLFPEEKRCPSDYLDTLVQVLEPAVRRVRQLLVVTSKEHNARLRHALEERLRALNPGCRFRHCCSENFHDRFWIADKTRGPFVGTSLNGLGRRYALADYLAADDVREITAALASEGILG